MSTRDGPPLDGQVCGSRGHAGRGHEVDWSWLVGHASQLGGVVAKAALMYVTAWVGFRFGERRTLAQWTIIDFATAVAAGAIIGRTAVASTQSYLTGAVALLTLIVVHRLASLLRFRPLFSRLSEHPIRILVADGKLQRTQLRLSGLTDSDLYAQLRQRGVFDLSELAYVLYEAKGALTVIPQSAIPLPELARTGVERATNWAPSGDGPHDAPGRGS